jgi:hypothetical protein
MRERQMVAVSFTFFIALFISPAAWAIDIQPATLAQYGCTGTAPKILPRIIIYGEKDHYSQGDIQNRAAIIEDGIQGKQFVGLEGLSNEVSWLKIVIPGVNKRDVPTARVFGLEDALSRGYTDLLHARNEIINLSDPKDPQNKAPNHSRRMDAAKAELLEAVRDNPEVQKAWKQMRTEGKFKTAEQEEIASLIDQMLKDSRMSASAVASAMADLRSWKNVANVQTVISAVGVVFVNRLSLPEYASRTDVPADKEKGRLYFQGKLTWEQEEQLIDEWVVRWRNRSFIFNVKKLYCQAVKENKPLVLSIGESHLEDLVRQLPGRAVPSAAAGRNGRGRP